MGVDEECVAYILWPCVTSQGFNRGVFFSIYGLAFSVHSTACQLPNCYCDATVIPGGLAANETPQILLIAFDGAVNMHNYDLYMQMFHEERRNPNGCPVRATFYLSHRWTDYSHVQNLYAVGHEIALRGVA